MWITVAAGPLPGSRAFPRRPVPDRSAAGRLAVRASAAAARDKHAQGVHDPERAARGRSDRLPQPSARRHRQSAHARVPAAAGQRTACVTFTPGTPAASCPDNASPGHPRQQPRATPHMRPSMWAQSPGLWCRLGYVAPAGGLTQRISPSRALAVGDSPAAAATRWEATWPGWMWAMTVHPAACSKVLAVR